MAWAKRITKMTEGVVAGGIALIMIVVAAEVERGTIDEIEMIVATDDTIDDRKTET